MSFMENTLSIQKLRENLPKVIKELQKGESFTLIYRSCPVGHLTPLGVPTKKSGLGPFLAKPSSALLFKSSKNSVNLIRKER